MRKSSKREWQERRNSLTDIATLLTKFFYEISFKQSRFVTDVRRGKA